MSYVLTPLSYKELTEFFDETAIKVIKFFLSKSIISQPEKIEGQDDLPIQIPKEHLEQWIVQSLGARPVGSGSYPVDVISSDRKWGADVKMLSCKVDKHENLTNADSGETSLAQKFSDSNFGDGISLDELFQKRDYESILDSWKTILTNKYNTVIEQQGISDIYYFIVLRAGGKFHLSGIRVNLDKIKELTVHQSRTTSESVFINNFIDPLYGYTKIYKAKKRLELRLKPLHWLNTDRLITFDTNFQQTNQNIRELIENQTLDSYILDHLFSNFHST